MFFIPGFIIATLTFPGVIVHEFAHQLFCRLARVAVFDVCYFRFGTPAGFVIHEPPRKPFQHVLIGIGPFFVNTIVGAVIAFPAAIPIFTFKQGTFFDYVLVWLGISIAMHAFPSTGDAKSISAALKKEGVSRALRIATMPIVGLIYLGAVGSFIWLDVFYGVTVATALPNFLVSIFA